MPCMDFHSLPPTARLFSSTKTAHSTSRVTRIDTVYTTFRVCTVGELAPYEQGEIGPDLFRAGCTMGLQGYCLETSGPTISRRKITALS